jgi:POT family proton-dependent oligopeptide transporter
MATAQRGLGDAASDRAFFGHPRGLSTLFFTEMWERFSYYGMRAILTLFMLAAIEDGGLGFSKAESGPIYAMYTSLVYLMCIPGGWLADNIFGQRKSVFYGGVVIMTGHILLAFHGFGLVTFYAGLGCVVFGTGLLKPNISVIVGQLYTQEDTRRESGFSIFYMGINLGAFLAPLTCGFLAQDPAWRSQLISWGLDPKNAWHWGFGAAAVGMFFGLVQYLRTSRRLGEAGLLPAPVRTPAETASRKRTLTIGLVVLVATAVGVALLSQARPDLLTKDHINTAYQILLGAVVIGFFGHLFLAGDWSPGERNRLVVIVILFAAAAIFWGVFEQAGSTLTIFADESTNNAVFGHAFPSSWWQSLNALLIVFIAPFFAWLWLAVGKRNPSYGTKFGVGLVFVGLGFLYLVFGAEIFSTNWADYVSVNRDAILAAGTKYGVAFNPSGIQVSEVSALLAKARDGGVTDLLPAWHRVGVHWLFVVYLLHTIGELWLSPVGLAGMTKLAPRRIVGQMMGVWFLAASIGNYLGGSVSGYYERFSLPTLLTMVAASAFVMAAIMFILVIPMKRMLATAEAESSGASSP